MLNLLTKTVAAAVISAGAMASLAAADTRLQGGGSTFVNPIMQRWVGEHQQAQPDTKIDYQSIGSGGGIKGISDRTLDFAASDAPMSKKEQDAVKDAVVHIPLVAGAVVPAYNLHGL